MSAAARRPLEGRRVLLTRAADDCASWAARLAQAGAVPIVLPCIATEPIATPELRAALRAASATADWLVFTSRRGVEAAAEILGGRAALPERCRIAAVGQTTAAAARAAFGRVDVVGDDGTAAGLASALAAAPLTPATHVVLALAENARDVLERAVTAAAARCTRCDVYRTVPAARLEPRRALSALGADNIVLASPSAVTGLLNRVALDAPAAIYTIGPSTSAAARAAGLEVTAQAREPSLEGILEAMQWRN
jgi:uroporphyrinogen-III synthase